MTISDKTYPTEPAHLEDYAIVVAGNETLLGKCGELEAPWSLVLPNAIKLENAYVLLGNYGPSPDGKQFMRMRIVVPIEMLSSAGWKLVVPTSIFPLSQLDDTDKRTMLNEIGMAEKGRMALRASKAGIVTLGGGR